MLVKGNVKLGNIWNWSIPAIYSCPGSTDLCRKICYACRGAYVFRSVQESHSRNWKFSGSSHFVSSMIGFIRHRKVQLVRIHAAGDFDKASYVRRWRDIIKASPQTQFYAYTRSWRKTGLTPPGLIESIRDLSRLPNLRLWLSCDHETGEPPRWPRCPTCWLADNDQRAPDYPVDLVFRNVPEGPLRFFGEQLSQICPYEMGFAQMKVSCETCRICFDTGRKVLRDFDDRSIRPVRRRTIVRKAVVG